MRGPEAGPEPVLVMGKFKSPVEGSYPKMKDHSGEAALVLGNGPSLPEALKSLERTEAKRPLRTIGVNRSWRLLEADYHCSIDAVHRTLMPEHPRQINLHHISPWNGGMVLPRAIAFAVELGFDEIYLLGVDLKGSHFNGQPSNPWALKHEAIVLKQAKSDLDDWGIRLSFYRCLPDKLRGIIPVASKDEVLGL